MLYQDIRAADITMLESVDSSTTQCQLTGHYNKYSSIYKLRTFKELISKTMVLANINPILATYQTGRTSTPEWMTRVIQVALNQQPATPDNKRIAIYYIKGNVVENFTAVQEYAATNNIAELKNFSLALKCSMRHKVRVYKKENSYVIITAADPTDNYNDWLLLRKIVSIIPLMYNTETVLNKSELFTAYLKDDAAECIQYIEKFLIESDYYRQVALEKQHLIYSCIQNTTLKRYQHNLDTVTNNINELEQELNIKYHKMNQLRLLIAGWAHNKPEFDFDLLDKLHFEGKIKIHARGIAPDMYCDSVVITIKTDCFNYDSLALEQYIENEFDANEPAVKVIRDIFIDENATYYFTEDVKLDLESGSVSYIGSANGTMPNPHHEYYNCWGNYKSIIEKQLIEGNFVDAIFQTITAVGSLNTTDYTVIRKFINNRLSGDVRYGGNPCIERDNNLYSVKDYYNKFLKEN